MIGSHRNPKRLMLDICRGFGSCNTYMGRRNTPSQLSHAVWSQRSGAPPARAAAARAPARCGGAVGNAPWVGILSGSGLCAPLSRARGAQAAACSTRSHATMWPGHPRHRRTGCVFSYNPAPVATNRYRSAETTRRAAATRSQHTSTYTGGAGGPPIPEADDRPSTDAHTADGARSLVRFWTQVAGNGNPSSRGTP
jgi:hypothetical protein